MVILVRYGEIFLKGKNRPDVYKRQEYGETLKSGEKSERLVVTP